MIEINFVVLFLFSTELNYSKIYLTKYPIIFGIILFMIGIVLSDYISVYIEDLVWYFMLPYQLVVFGALQILSFRTLNHRFIVSPFISGDENERQIRKKTIGLSLIYTFMFLLYIVIGTLI